MTTDRLSFFTIDSSYCNFLYQFDHRVPDNTFSKTDRPFIGIVFTINDFHYYASLTSPKHKHKNMENTIDFLKINDGECGAINFNNMDSCSGVFTHKSRYLIIADQYKR
ncbi:hypothetical protein MsAg5_10750 [Methanosarcinaceae archaeon Ag5]|uniref:Uncharacterized protein n=1 Tax=Methanolapillus africanus TaxID=3028297 RepID=A0AAE4MJP4_9EURY|nr:hypothetical protein [Methanosarcinaceae archaeon Ag5]